MRVCHIADVHWRGLKRHEEYTEVFERLAADAKKQKVDRIVVAGDIVHTKTMGISPELIQRLTWWFNRLAEIAPVIVTLGNHDGLILNKSRMDTITPIINTLSNPRIIFLRDSMQYYDDEFGVVWTNFSCFDEENWGNLKPIENKINISLFHGPIAKSMTDIGWEIESECDLSLFAGFDFGMFGDIHKFQYLDTAKRFAYPGSTIQQDYSEDIDKGYLLWDIRSKDEFRSVRRVIKSPNPFYTIEWDGTADLTFASCDGFSKGCRLRVMSDQILSQEDIKKFSFLVKSTLEPSELTWRITEHQNASNILIGESELEQSSLRNEEFHNKALREYFGESKFTQEEWERIDNTVYSILHSFENFETNRNRKWSIRNMEWENTFAYGKGNRIDFSSLEGVIGLFGVNRCGKSSIPGTLMYSLFNDTDRGSISNLHVINARKGDCEAKVEFEMNGNLYRAERMSIKWSNPRGVGANTKMNLYRIDESGEIIEDISGEQRRDSDKALRELIGEPSDFLLTSFASQGEMNTFIRNGATDRKKLLNNFLDLGIFDQILVKLKEESYNTKVALKQGSNVNYEVAIEDCNDKIHELNNSKSNLEKRIEDLKKKQISLNVSLATSRTGSGYTRSDIKSKEQDLTKLQNSLISYEKSMEEIDEKIKQQSSRLEKISSIKNNFPIDALKQELSSLRQLEIGEAKLSSDLEKENEKLKQQQKSISRLSEVPCGDKFPTCKFIKDSHRDKTLIETQRLTIENLTQQLKDANDSISLIKSKSIEEKLKKYEAVLREEIGLDAASKASSIEKNSYASKSIDALKKIKEIEEKIVEMKLNLIDEDNAAIIESIESELKETTGSLRQAESNLLNTERMIGSEISNLAKHKNDKEKYSEHVKDWKIFEALIQAYGKNGLPQVVLAQQLPRINQEIASILQGICGFTVVLVSDGNNLDVNLDYGDSQRPVELGSGMEKMMASLALRVALINVSSLPKSDMFIIDEGFGALDDVNVEACNRLLVSLKRFFKTIIVISHVDAIKDAVDNIIEISKQGADAYVWA